MVSEFRLALKTPFYSPCAALATAGISIHSRPISKLPGMTLSTWGALAFLPDTPDHLWQPGVSPTSSEKSSLWAVNSQSWSSPRLEPICETAHYNRWTSRVPGWIMSSPRPVATFQFSPLLSLAQMVSINISQFFSLIDYAWSDSLRLWR